MVQKAMYIRVIKHPMSFLTIKDFIRKSIPPHKIRTYRHLGLAIDLIIANCARFNGPQSDFTRLARTFRVEYDRVVALQQDNLEQKLQQSLLLQAQAAELGARRPRTAFESLPRRCAFGGASGM
jgi:hypothetical protein